MIDLGRIGPSLVRDAQGIWVARGTPPVSYPEGGHAACLGVEEASFWFRHRNQCILAAVHRFGLGAEGALFDVGAGNGFVARALADSGLPVVAVEPGPEGARNMRRRGLEHVVCATTDVCGFSAGCAAAVGAFDVVEHMPDDLMFLRELRRLIAPGGRLFATVPAYGWLWSAEDDEAGHHRRYTLSSLAQLLERAGFELEYGSHFFRWLVPAILLMRALPYRLGLRRQGGQLRTNAREHGLGVPRAAAFVEGLLRAEAARIANGQSMAFGASLLIVARRRADKASPPNAEGNPR